MNLVEVCKNLQLIGLRAQVQNTNHPDFVRVFALLDDPSPSALDTPNVPTSLGRITVERGQYSHVKWYIGINAGPHLADWQRYVYAWNYLLQTGKVLTAEQWADVTARAVQLAQEHRDQKLEWRKQNPKLDASGQPKSRTKLAPPNPHRYIWSLLTGQEVTG